MPDRCLTAISSAWTKTLSLDERLSQAKLHRLDSDAEVGRDRFESWRQTLEPAPGALAARLRLLGLTEAQFAELLGVSDQSLAAYGGPEPEWVRWAATVLEAAVDSPDSLDWLRTQPSFIILLQPAIQESYDRVRKELARNRSDAASETFHLDTDLQPFVNALCYRLEYLLTATLTLELNVYRLCEKLTGDTPEERFSSFLHLLRTPEMRAAIFEEYPSLFRTSMRVIELWERDVCAFVTDLRQDWSDIAQTFGVPAHARLQTVRSGLGDCHRGGRSVSEVVFDTGHRLIYKPRALALDVHFQQFLSWLNAGLGGTLSFRVLNVLDKGDHGWQEFVESAPCSDTSEVKEFYRRHGGLIGILFLLDGTDFHFENVIAAGSQPVLVDLEALFHPRVDLTRESPLRKPANQVLANSVLRCGLLPQPMWITAAAEALDLSGIGGHEGQVTPYKVPVWRNYGRDDMKMAYEKTEEVGFKNRPSLTGGQIRLADYLDEIEQGFLAVYDFLARNKRDLLAPDGPLMRFQGDEIRFIIRPTRFYYLFQSKLYHPDLFRDGLERERVLDSLFNLVPELKQAEVVSQYERQALEDGDIPAFYARTGSSSLFAGDGVIAREFFMAVPMDVVRERARQLGEEDLQRQAWLVRASLASAMLNDETGSPSWYTPPRSRTKDLDDGDIKQEAIQIGRKLSSLALRAGECVNWIGLNLQAEKIWTLEPLGVGLYSGLPGMLLFFTYLAKETGESGFLELAQDIERTLELEWQEFSALVKPPSISLSPFSDWLGWAYVLCHVAKLWRRPELLKTAAEICRRAGESIAADKKLDIIDGCAGFIGVASCLQHCDPSLQTVELIRHAAERLLATADSSRAGFAWMTELSSVQPLTGYSHGASGMSWALVQAYRCTADRRYLTAAAKPLEYENSVFSADLGNWPDFRTDSVGVSGVPSYALDWCHGAPGIGLARILSLPELDSPAIRHDIEVAIHTTFEQGLGRNHCLCHGDLGNLETLLQGSIRVTGNGFQVQYVRARQQVMSSLKTNGPLCGTPQCVETPGLMTGLAGIGFGILRSVAPARIPNVLSLAPPPAS